MRLSSLAHSPAPGKSVDHPEIHLHPDHGKLPPTLKADRRLSSTDKLVAETLISFAWFGKAECNPGLATIGALIGRGIKAVKLAVRQLQHFGYVRIERDGYPRNGNRYTLLWRLGIPPAAPPPCAPSPRQRESDRVGRASREVMRAEGCNQAGATGCKTTPEFLEGETEKERSRPSSLAQKYAPESAPAGTCERAGEGASEAPIPAPVDATGAFARLSPASPTADRERAARLLQHELGESGRDGFLSAYRGLASEVSRCDAGGLTTAAVAYALAEAGKPQARNRGAVFASAIGRCRPCGGLPPSPATAGHGQAKQVPAPPVYRRDPFRRKATVISAAVEAIQGRVAGGLTAEANRATTLARASATCDSRGIEGDARTDYLTWIGEALAHALDGAPMPDTTAYWRSALQAVGHLPRRAAV